MVHGFTNEDPAHVRPPFSIARRMRITLVVRELVMNTVRSHPEDGTAFETQCAAEGQKILDPLGSSVASMCEQSVIAHSDTQASRYPPENNCDKESFPGKKEQRRDCADMKCGHEKGCYPVDVAVGGGLLYWWFLILHNCALHVQALDVRH